MPKKIPIASECLAEVGIALAEQLAAIKKGTLEHDWHSFKVGHCKTCKHFEHLDPNATTGICKTINSNGYLKRLAFIGAEEENLFLDVDEDFGCVLHEPKKEETDA